MLFRKEKVRMRLAEVLSVPSFSINSLTHTKFQNLFKELNSEIKIPASHTGLTKILLEHYASKKKLVVAKIGKILPGVRPSITLDIWSDSSLTQSFVGVTLHGIIGDGNLKTWFLGLKELKGKKSGTKVK